MALALRHLAGQPFTRSTLDVGGVMLRGLLDCLVAAVAWRTSSTLLARGVEISRVAQVVGIELDDASTR